MDDDAMPMADAPLSQRSRALRSLQLPPPTPPPSRRCSGGSMPMPQTLPDSDFRSLPPIPLADGGTMHRATKKKQPTRLRSALPARPRTLLLGMVCFLAAIIAVVIVAVVGSATSPPSPPAPPAPPPFQPGAGQVFDVDFGVVVAGTEADFNVTAYDEALASLISVPRSAITTTVVPAIRGPLRNGCASKLQPSKLR
ncbi:hypothetical protein AB1Y20_011080 [Prymnesium parvum]|uniref:Uncharacterized protein n=1 Tax=Prymnesium parvum TaxID=97485 RepID=A0AB34IKT2_PRYPA